MLPIPATCTPVSRAMLLNKCRLQLEVSLELCLSVQRAVEEGLASGGELEGRGEPCSPPSCCWATSWRCF